MNTQFQTHAAHRRPHLLVVPSKATHSAPINALFSRRELRRLVAEMID